MSLFVFVTPECAEDQRRHGKEAEVARLVSKLEDEQTVVTLDRFPPPYLKKRMGRMRLIVEERRLGGDQLICFVRMMYRGDAAYSAFCKESESIRRTYQLSNGVLADYLKERQRKPLPAAPPLSQTEEEYLQATLRPAEADQWTVLETRLWVERMQHPDRLPYLSSYAELVQEVCLSPRDGERMRTHTRNPDVAVLYRAFFPSATLVLIAPFGPTEPAQEPELPNSQQHLLDLPDDSADDVLLRSSRRQYPRIATLEEDAWISIQQESDANLALSPEEMGIVEALRQPDPGDGAERHGFPLFINGRPGSGKSTVLQYLFADLLFFHYTRSETLRTQYPPLYLTYSQPLLRRAQEVVEKVLRLDAKNIVDSRKFRTEELETSLKGSFGEFKTFLLDALAPDIRRRFTDAAFVDYPRFRQLWEKRFGRGPNRHVRDIGPEVSWHVIRSYVKGMREEGGDYFDCDCYAEHPAKRKSVDDETFKIVFEQVWEAWYRQLCDEGTWDHQDLAREALKSASVFPRYPAIFCDEAQDFTWLELELIFRLSVYSARMVPGHLMHRVPFAFAGDPFQTLNPTGFNWRALRADFHDKIVANIDRRESRRLSINFNELTFNYRSTEPIVRLCNSLQILRGIGLGGKDIAPQKTWFSGSEAVPVVFNESDGSARRALKEQTEVVVIIPCHEGGEHEYVRNDPLLASIALDGESLRRNILSPMRAKGLEFKRVVLYKFGEEASKTRGVLEMMNEAKPLDDTPQATLPVEYFLNRVYVAASRAQSRLLAVDSERGIRSFWRVLGGQNARERLLAGYQALFSSSAECAWSIDDLGRIIDGTAEDWEQSRDDPFAVATKFLEEGRAERDTFFLERARDAFKQLGDQGKAKECEALIHEFNGELREAGAAYAELGKVERAVECWWKGGCHAELARIEDQGIRERPELLAARFMVGERTGEGASEFVNGLYGVLQDVDYRAKLLSDTERWFAVVGSAVSSLEKAAGDPAAPLTEAAWKRACSQLMACRTHGLDFPETPALARIAHRAGDMRGVVDLWRRSGRSGPEPEWVLEALADTEPYPASLRYLVELGRPETVVELYLANVGMRLPREAARIVKASLVQQGRVEESIQLLGQYPDDAGFAGILWAPARESWREYGQQTAELLVGHLAQEARFEEAVMFARDGVFLKRKPGGEHLISLVNLEAVAAACIRLLAVSSKLSESAGKSSNNVVMNYLAKVLEADNALERYGLHLWEAGGALERAGRVEDVLRFYKRFVDSKEVAKADVDFARLRTLCILKERSQTQPGKRSQKELSARSQAWNIAPGAIDQQPRFPEGPGGGRVRPGPKLVRGQAGGSAGGGRIGEGVETPQAEDMTSGGDGSGTAGDVQQAEQKRGKGSVGQAAARVPNASHQGAARSESSARGEASGRATYPSDKQEAVSAAGREVDEGAWVAADAQRGPEGEASTVAFSFQSRGERFEGMIRQDTHRLEIRHAVSAVLVTVLGAMGAVRSVDLDDIIEEVHGTERTFQIREWGMTIRMSNNGGETRADVSIDGRMLLRVVL